MDLTIDRREAARVDMGGFGPGHTAHLVYPGGFLNAALLDLGPSGARVALKGGVPAQWLTRGTKLLFNPLLGADGQLRQDLPCEVRWVAGRKIGLRFTPQLCLSVNDVHALVSLGRQF